MKPLSRCDQAPAPGPKFWVRRLLASEEDSYVIMGSKVHGFYVHWAGGHSEPCYQDHSICEGHKRGYPIKWKGYLHVYEQSTRKHCFFELTPFSFKQLEDQVPRSESMRGFRFKAKRGKGDKARVRITVLGYSANQENYGPEMDPEATLRELWGYTKQEALDSDTLLT